MADVKSVKSLSLQRGSLPRPPEANDWELQGLDLWSQSDSNPDDFAILVLCLMMHWKFRSSQIVDSATPAFAEEAILEARKARDGKRGRRTQPENVQPRHF